MGTPPNLLCPFCKSFHPCGSIPPTKIDRHRNDSREEGELFFRRGRKCKKCSTEFTTIEIDEDDYTALRDQARKDSVQLKALTRRLEKYFALSAQATSTLEDVRASVVECRAIRVRDEVKELFPSKDHSDAEFVICETKLKELEIEPPDFAITYRQQRVAGVMVDLGDSHCELIEKLKRYARGSMGSSAKELWVFNTVGRSFAVFDGENLQTRDEFEWPSINFSISAKRLRW